MKINNLDKLHIKDNHKPKILEEILDTEVADIMRKSRNQMLDNMENKSTLSDYRKRNTNYLYEDNNKYSNKFVRNNLFEEPKEEPILPFNQEEIRPVLRDYDNKDERYKNNFSYDNKSNSYENFEIDLEDLCYQLRPFIEEIIDEKLKKYTYEINKPSKHINKKEQPAYVKQQETKNIYEKDLDIRNPNSNSNIKEYNTDYSNSRNIPVSENNFVQSKRVSYKKPNMQYDTSSYSKEEVYDKYNRYQNDDDFNYKVDDKIEYYKNRSSDRYYDNFRHNEEYNRNYANSYNENSYRNEQRENIYPDPKQGKLLEDYPTNRRRLRENKYNYDK